jgi:5-oxoprolinase (ATP-hydrolysing)
VTRVYVDRGGTFTDVVVVSDDGAVTTRKVPSDRAIVGELAAAAGASGDAVVFGTTVATNALLTREGAPTLLIVNRGFGDLPWIGDQTRPELFDADARWPAPLCAEVIEADGRLDANGRELEAFGAEALAATMASTQRGATRSVAIAFVNSHRDGSHEHEAAAIVRTALPSAFVSCGHEVSPELGYLARVETALVDAAITPVLQDALARDRIPERALAIRSDGSLAPARSLRAPDAVLSGPAGGVLAVAAIALEAGFERAVGLDMGGTSTDVCRVEAGRLPFREGETRVAGVRLRRPTLEVETIAAGGGSIVASDGVRLTVGPASAGAHPGPQCYGRGGPPTVTDAALAAGLIDPASFDPPLDPSAVRLPAEAHEILDVAREAMARAVRRIATARGVGLDDHALVSYGGAAGQHAAEVAARLGITTVLVHPCASVLCAWGQSLARREERGARAIWASLPEAWDAVEAAWRTLEAEGRAAASLWTERSPPEVEHSVELRYAGTDHGIEIPMTPGERDIARFEAEHRERYGFERSGEVIEAVTARVRVRAPAPAVLAVDDDPWRIGDAVLEGPRRVDGPGTAIWIPAGWVARRERGLLRLEQRRRARTAPATERTPHRIELWGNRFASVAEQAGEVLRRLARSVNIRERLDFSCAVFDSAGSLVANAPHVPVHLGAMGETVRDLLRAHPSPEPGQAWLTNDPAAGGSHLPDLTVVTAVAARGGGPARWFVACRGHHVDVGGITPGSMPPRSRRLDEEGFVVRQLPLLEGTRLRVGALRAAIAGCREPETVLADIAAQVAANAHAARSLVELSLPGASGPGVIDAWMAHLHDAADESVRAVAGAVHAGGVLEAEDVIGRALPLRVSLRAEPDGFLVVDFTGTGGPDDGNLNAPPSVLRAAVLYTLRSLVRRSIPLNEGALRSVRIVAPAPSLVAPPPGAAVVGGNVETSQALVDLMLRAAGARAGSQGTMNNLTFGGAGWAYYETIGGGVGATPEAPGDSGRQVHMTNTRQTDVEVLEARRPLRVLRLSLRRGSGGGGVHRGGDGVARELELLAPATAALLASRRGLGAPGLGGGERGAPGRDWIRRSPASEWEAWDGAELELSAGARVRIETPGGGGWAPEK